MMMSVLWLPGKEGESKISQPSRVFWKQHGYCRETSWVYAPVLVLATCVSVVDQLASPSFFLTCNKVRAPVIPSWAAMKSKERTVHMSSSVSDIQLGLRCKFLNPRPSLNLYFFYPDPMSGCISKTKSLT